MEFEELVIHIEPDGRARLAAPPPQIDVPFARRRPSRALEQALAAAPDARPPLLAEYWHLLVTGSYHDPVYNLAVALDARGDALGNPPRLLAATLAAAARRVPPQSQWRIGELPDSSDPVAAALHALSFLPRDLDFVCEWASSLLNGGLIGASDARPAAPPSEPQDEVVRRWSVPCDFGSRRGTFPVLVGRPAPGFHPLCFQAAWIRERRGGVIPPEAMARVREHLAAPELAR